MDKNILEFVISELSKLYSLHHIEENHTISHSLDVLSHLEKCLEYEHDIDEYRELCLKCAAILHDADDRKFFPNNANYENAVGILKKVQLLSDGHIQDIIKIISLVSFSENGNSIPEGDRWMLLVRWCDRLESIGKPGILRAYTYSLFIDRPLFLESTPRPKTIEDIYKECTLFRYNRYLEKKNSDSMMDHFFDKIIFVCDDLVKCQNPYISKESADRKNDTLLFLLEFGIGTFNELFN